MIGPSCEELARRSTSGELENAPLMTRLLARMHMAMCVHCRRFEAQMRLISASARRLWGAAPDPERVAALKKRILA